MKRYVKGKDRSQSVLFPEKLDDYIGEDNPVRLIDVFVDELPLEKLGFDGMEPEETLGEVLYVFPAPAHRSAAGKHQGSAGGLRHQLAITDRNSLRALSPKQVALAARTLNQTRSDTLP